MVGRACADDGLSSKISGLSGLLSISSILSLVLLVFPRPSKGSVWGSTQTHVGAGTRALLGPRASASRRRALRGAARGGADAVSRFPLLAPEARCGALGTPILATSKNMSWPRLARPRDLVGSLVWRGDDHATENFLPRLFACAIVPALCSVVIPDDWK